MTPGQLGVFMDSRMARPTQAPVVKPAGKKGVRKEMEASLKVKLRPVWPQHVHGRRTSGECLTVSFSTRCAALWITCRGRTTKPWRSVRAGSAWPEGRIKEREQGAKEVKPQDKRKSTDRERVLAAILAEQEVCGRGEGC